MLGNIILILIYLFRGYCFVGGASGTTALIDISADGDECKFTHCHFLSGAAAPVDIVTMTGAHYVTFDSCFFEARQLKDFELHFVETLCFGCGCCVPNCPEEAIQIEFNPERGIPIPSL